MCSNRRFVTVLGVSRQVFGIFFLAAALVGVGSAPVGATVPRQTLDPKYCKNLSSYLEFSEQLLYDRLKDHGDPKVRGVGDESEQTTDVAQQGTTFAATCLGRQLVARVGERTLFLAVRGAQPSAKALKAAARAIVARMGS